MRRTFSSRESFQRTLLGVDKDMVHLQSLYMKAVEKSKAKKAREAKYTPEAKYTVYGYAIALQYWAYEVIVQFGSKYATSLGVKTLGMLTWTSNQVILASNYISIFSFSIVTTVYLNCIELQSI